MAIGGLCADGGAGAPFFFVWLDELRCWKGFVLSEPEPLFFLVEAKELGKLGELFGNSEQLGAAAVLGASWGGGAHVCFLLWRP